MRRHVSFRLERAAACQPSFHRYRGKFVKAFCGADRESAVRRRSNAREIAKVANIRRCKINASRPVYVSAP